MRRMITASVIVTAVLAMGGYANARRWQGPGGRGHGMGGHPMGGHGRCGRMLMRMHPQELKAKLNLNDTQLARVTAVRNNVQSKQIDLRAKVARHGLKLRQLMEADLPAQNKVLAEMRKMRRARGILTEERIKAFIAFLTALTPEQRKQLRSICPREGRGFGNRGRRGPRGPRGYRGGGGWGPQGRGPGAEF